MADLIQELRRRNVFRAAIAYLAVSWLIIEVATTILPLYPEAPAWLPRTLVTVLFLGFIPALIISWAFELTSEGLRRDQHDDSVATSHLRINRLVDFVIGGAVVAAIALLLWSPTQANRVPSIAVLPFDNMSADAGNEYFADGITEAIIHMIAQSRAIKVTSRTSVFALKGQNVDVREIGSMLDVAHVLEGSVQRAGDQLRITAQLIDTADGNHIWSKSYDRSASDIFDIQDEIAGVVANALKTSLLAKPEVIDGIGTQDTRAYDLYLHAAANRITGTIDALGDAEQSLKQALAIDPEFHTAKTELAAIYLDQWWFGFKSKDEALPDILSLTEQVLAGKGFDSHALALQLMVQSEAALSEGKQDDLQVNADKLYALAERAPNNVDVRIFLATVLGYLGDSEGHFEQLRQATVIDPLRADLYWRMSLSQADLGDTDGAMASIRRSLELNPEQVLPYLTLAEMQRAAGDTVGYLENHLRAWQQDPGDVELVAPVAWHLYGLRLIPEGDVYLQHARALAPNHGAVHTAELIRASMQNFDEQAIEASKVLVEEFEGGNRFRGWVYAAKNLLRSGLRQGRGDAQLAYLSKYAPEFADPEAATAPLHVRLAQALAVPELAQLLPREIMLGLLDDVDEFYSVRGGARASDMQYYISSLIVRGELETAIETYLSEISSRPASMRIAEDWRLDTPFMAELASDPRIQAELEKAQQEIAKIREDVREFLATQQDMDFQAGS